MCSLAGFSLCIGTWSVLFERPELFESCVAIGPAVELG